MTKGDERRRGQDSLRKYRHPFDLHLNAPAEEIYLRATTTGTSGTPTFSYTFTQRNINFIAPRLGHRFKLVGLSKGDRVIFFLALGVYVTIIA
jgi:phenylacetate-CoA ligase